MSIDSSRQSVTTATLGWLLLCQLLVIAPFLVTHPIWLPLLLVGCLAWRAQALRMGVVSLWGLAKFSVALVGLARLGLSGFRE